MKDKPWYAVVYMFVVTAFFSSVVIGFAMFTKDKVEANQQLAFEKSVLQVFGLAQGKATSQLHAIFLKRIRISKDDNLASVAIDDQGKPSGYVVLLAGKGFWAPIKGVLGLATDKRTITGIAFYEQNETPGLGGKITEKEFKDQFAGIELADNYDAIGIKPFGAELSDNQVHAITGATQTCTRLEQLINDSIKQWRKTIEENK
ncbi:MAG TPA: FMN-binding protein [Phycisphaerales bacterium]|nr:FMN-binding protein [Phycisphaerales bacterium]